MIIAYDIAATASGSCGAAALKVQLRAGPLVSDPDAVIGVTVDADPMHRTPGAEIEVEFSRGLTVQESSDVADAIALHDHSQKPVHGAAMVSAESTGTIPPGGRCQIDTTGGPSERYLPHIADAGQRPIIVSCKGASDMTIRVQANDPHNPTIGGAATLVLADGDHAVLHSDGANWVNLGPVFAP